MKWTLKSLVCALILAAIHSRAEDSALATATAEIVQTAKKAAPDMAAEKTVVSKIIDALAAKELETDEVARKDPQHFLDQIEFVVSRPGAEKEREAFCAFLSEKLGGALHVPAKVWMLKSLERIGKAESVGAEIKLLNDASPLVRETARRALAANPSSESSSELVKAIEAATDVPARIALIEALGFKRNKADVALFEKELQHADAHVKTAATAALAAQGIRKDAGVMEQAAELVDAGREGKVVDVRKLVAALESPDVKIRQAAVQAVALHTSSEMTAALLDNLKTVNPEVKPALIAVISQRGGNDALSVLIDEIKSKDAAVRAAAIQGTANFSSAAAFQPLLNLARGGGDEQRLAREALSRIKSPEIDEKLAATLTNSDNDLVKEALFNLAARISVSASPAVMKLLSSADAGVRTEALKTLGAIGGKDALDSVLSVIAKADDKNDAERDAAKNAVVSISRRLPENDGHVEAIAKAAKESGEPARIALLTALGQIGGAQALNPVHDALKDANEKIQDAAFRALANWPDASPIDEMLELAKTATNETHRVLALRAFVRMAALPHENAKKDPLTLVISANEAVKTPDDRKLILNALSEIKDFGAVKACAQYIADPKVSEEACVATVKAAKRFETGHADAVAAAMKEVLAHAKNKSTKEQAQTLLDKQGKK